MKQFLSLPLPWPADYYYEGDNRAFGYGTALSSRSIQSADVTLNPAIQDGPLSGANQFFGTTIGYDDDPDGEDIDTGPPWPCQPYIYYPIAAPAAGDDCISTATPGVDSNILTMTYERMTQSEAKVSIILRGENACQTAPTIDSHLYVHFRQTCENGSIGPLQFRLYGTHDGFPWHELYINRVLVYKHDPCLTGEGPFSLGGGEEWQFEVFSPTHPPFDGNEQLPLSEWRVVPGLDP